ncbi:unnamed protein product [Periconia digitata]|uniref:PARP-type domain-containing protein n=1 Tax=Periconia digitata TaxID=1303443 RepID=A0A9W4XYS9_9PLEO|nr:unnamed protein product [Periconia digitata]
MQVGPHLNRAAAYLPISLPPALAHNTTSTAKGQDKEGSQLFASAYISAKLQSSAPPSSISGYIRSQLSTTMPYRVEVASQGRAGCKNTECKNAAVKIAKGEFRMGTLVTIQEHTSWTWKHWGCVTPLQIGHLQEESGGDTDMVDGYDELPSELQEKVKYALEHGHVEDSDWKGDIEVNRPGQKGFRVNGPKNGKKAKKAKKASEDGATSDEAAAPPPKKKRGRAVKDESEDDEPEAPAPKKARGRPKKAAVKGESDQEQEAPVAKKTRGRPKKAAVKAEPESNVKEPKAKKAAKGKRSAVQKEVASDIDEDEDSESEKPSPQTVKKAAASKRGRKKKTATDDD